MTAVMSSPARSPYMAAIIVLLLVWSIWYLEVPGQVSTAVQTHTDAAHISQGHDTKVSADEQEILPTEGSVAAVPTNPISDRPLILYAYSETASARTNLQFFIKHGLHAAADFVFIMNGQTNAIKLIPQADNIRYIQRPNDCYDLGAYAEVLTKNDLYKGYKRYIMLNASIRGPFLPYWAESCWSDMYLRRVTDEVKLVGMTANCWPQFHVQSMIWATDRTGIELLLFPPKSVTDSLNANFEELKAKISGTSLDTSDDDDDATEEQPEALLPPGINSCFHTWSTAVHAEIGASAIIEAAGYKLDVMMSLYHKSANYEQECDSSKNGDVLWNKKYEGTNVHPYETIFLKSNRDIDPVGLRKLTEWTDGSGYSSYQFCKA